METERLRKKECNRTVKESYTPWREKAAEFAHRTPYSWKPSEPEL